MDGDARTSTVRILTVDDEPMVLDAIGLELDGYRVDKAESGMAALELLRANQYDVVLCDLTMPGMSGMELHENLCRTMPEVTARMVFVTAGARTAEGRAFLARVRHVEKPFEPGELRAFVEQLLVRHQRAPVISRDR